MESTQPQNTNAVAQDSSARRAEDGNHPQLPEQCKPLDLHYPQFYTNCTQNSNTHNSCAHHNCPCHNSALYYGQLQKLHWCTLRRLLNLQTKPGLRTPAIRTAPARCTPKRRGV